MLILTSTRFTFNAYRSRNTRHFQNSHYSVAHINGTRNRRPKVKKGNRVRLFANATLFSNDTQRYLSRYRVTLVNSRRHINAIIRAPLTRFTRQRIQSISLLNKLSRFHLFSANRSRRLPSTQLTINLISNLIFKSMNLLILKNNKASVHMSNNVVRTFISRSLNKNRRLTANAANAIKVLRIRRQVNISHALSSKRTSKLRLVTNRTRPQNLTQTSVTIRALVRKFNLPALLIQRWQQVHRMTSQNNRRTRMLQQGTNGAFGTRQVNNKGGALNVRRQPISVRRLTTDRLAVIKGNNRNISILVGSISRFLRLIIILQFTSGTLNRLTRQRFLARIDKRRRRRARTAVRLTTHLRDKSILLILNLSQLKVAQLAGVTAGQ